VTPPHAEVTDVEEDLLELMNKISKEKKVVLCL
jgi:hypothetical protein